jgi:hypothetical protein
MHSIAQEFIQQGIEQGIEKRSFQVASRTTSKRS